MLKFNCIVDESGDYMVTSGVVSGDLSSITSGFSQYDSSVSGLSGSWQGPSFDNFSSITSSFTSEFSSTISSEMEAFASACDLYKEYETKKNALKTAESNYNTAVAAKDTSAANNYSSEISQLNADITSLKGQIESQLSTASATKLEATSLDGTVAADGSMMSILSGSSTNIDWSDDANFKYFNQSGGWNRYRYSSGGSNSMGASGCGPSAMAMVMASLGYDVNPNVTADWSADHGYHPSGGTDEGFFTAYAKELGVQSRVLGYDKNAIASALSNNELVILHVGHGSYGDFTNNGHFIVARAYDPATNKVLIADPNRTRNNTWHDLDRVVNQLKGDEASWSYAV